MIRVQKDKGIYVMDMLGEIAFGRSDFLIPNGIDMKKWSVIACDQYTSDRKYWDDLNKLVGTSPSSLNLILPEVYLENDCSEYIKVINSNMQKYLDAGILREHRNCYIYIERQLASGIVRPGVVGVVDMEEYSYSDGVSCEVRPTEKTVSERIPPRKAIREKAAIELSHVIVFCNDQTNSLIGYLTSRKQMMEKIYDTELMKDGGYIQGWLVAGEIADKFDEKYKEYSEKMKSLQMPQLIVGDGNHSLATAKAVYEDNKDNGEARYAMVELENLYDQSIVFEPIHRILYNVDEKQFIDYVSSKYNGRYPLKWISKNGSGSLMLRIPDDMMPIEFIQSMIDEYLLMHGGTVDYVHDGVEEIVRANDHAIGLILPSINKNDIFDRIASKGVYPRKTFSVGEADDKRFYLEARAIK